jgi:hypothetical protein
MEHDGTQDQEAECGRWRVTDLLSRSHGYLLTFFRLARRGVSLGAGLNVGDASPTGVPSHIG